MFMNNQKTSKVKEIEEIVSVLRSILPCEKKPHKPVYPPKSVEEDWNEVIKIPIDKIEKDEILEIFKKRGIEAIAWYAPFHYFEADDWGIYYNLNVLKCLSEEIFGTVTFENILKIVSSIRYHEIFHFLIEMAISRLELMILLFNQKLDIEKIYELRNKIKEEVLATAYQYLKTQNKDELEYIFSNLPTPYSDYKNIIKKFDIELNYFFHEIFNVNNELNDLFRSVTTMWVVLILDQGMRFSELNIFSEILFKESSFLIPPEYVPERIII